MFLPKTYWVFLLYFFSKDFNVLHRLGEIAEYCVKRTGFFHSGPLLFCNKVRPHPRYISSRNQNKLQIGSAGNRNPKKIEFFILENIFGRYLEMSL